MRYDSPSTYVRKRTRDFAVLAALAAIVASAYAPPAAAAVTSVAASDSGFVTEVDGSSKGDGTVIPAAKFNYSVGFELHYGTGALFSPLAPMFRKNYFVFDLSGVTELIASAELKLWTGTLESVDAEEIFALHETFDQPGALALTTDLFMETSPTGFDEASDPLVFAAATLYSKLADGPGPLAVAAITGGVDDSFISISFTPEGVDYLSSVRLKVEQDQLVSEVG